MPWELKGNCVHKKTGEKVKCHESLEKAKAHMRALYASENKSVGFSEMGMVITKASRDKKTGEMRIRLVNSDTGEDVFGERMSLELFKDFVERNDANATIPEPFLEVIEKAEQGWYNGGPPYLSIAHYRSGGGKNVPGVQEKLYIDGEKLKSVDILHNNDLGNAVWKSIWDDLYSPEEEKSFENPVRVSIGFVDLEHKHVGEDGEEFIFTRKSLEDRCDLCKEGVGNKVYLKGHLVHKAFTRVPANQRTLVEVDIMAEKSDGINTKKADAESIIGDVAEMLEEKSQADEILVVKADEEGRDQEPLEETMETNEQEEVKEEEVPEAEVPETTEVPEVVEEVVEEEVEEPVAEEKSQLELSLESVKSRIEELKSQGIYGDPALKELQPIFDALGNVVKAEVTPPKLDSQLPMGDLAEIVKSTVREVLPDAVRETLPELKQEIVAQLVTELGGMATTKTSVVNDTPAPRSIQVQRSNLPESGQKQLSQIQRIAQKGLVDN